MFIKISTNTRLTNSCLRRTCGIRCECRRSTSMYAARQSGQKGWADFCRSMAVLAGGASLKVSATSTHRQRHGGVGRVWQRRASGAGESGAGPSQRLAVFAAQRLTTPESNAWESVEYNLFFCHASRPTPAAASVAGFVFGLRAHASQPRNHATTQRTQPPNAQRTAHNKQRTTSSKQHANKQISKQANK